MHDTDIQAELVALKLVKAAMSTDELTRTIALYRAERSINLRNKRKEYTYSRKRNKPLV